MIKELVAVFIGGGLGSVSRYAIALALKKFQLAFHGFPLHTFAVNIVGSFVVGLLIGYLYKNSAQWLSVLLVVGFCGGFTTFSSFTLETVQLLKTQQYGIAFLYIALSLLAGLAATYWAFVISK